MGKAFLVVTILGPWLALIYFQQQERTTAGEVRTFNSPRSMICREALWEHRPGS